MPEYSKNEAGLPIRQWPHRQSKVRRLGAYTTKHDEARQRAQLEFEQELAENNHIHRQIMIKRLVDGVNRSTLHTPSPVDDGWC